MIRCDLLYFSPSYVSGLLLLLAGGEPQIVAGLKSLKSITSNCIVLTFVVVCNIVGEALDATPSSGSVTARKKGAFLLYSWDRLFAFDTLELEV
jgi:hypothetical protein